MPTTICLHRVEELFLNSKSEGFELEAFSIRLAQALERLSLVAAIHILHGTTQGMIVQLDGLCTQVDLHRKWVHPSFGRRTLPVIPLSSTLSNQAAWQSNSVQVSKIVRGTLT